MHRWLVVVAACGGGSSVDTPAVVLGETQTAFLSSSSGGGFAIDFTTGVIGGEGDLGLGSNDEVGTEDQAYVFAVGPVDDVAGVPLPPDDFGKSATASTGVGLAVRTHDGCAAAVHVVDHTNTPTTNDLSIEYALADCEALELTVAPMPANAGCTMSMFPTPSPRVVLVIDGWPGMEHVLVTTETLHLRYPRGAHVTVATEDREPTTPASVTFAGDCTGADCALAIDRPRTATATVTWTPRCIPGA